jgi:hypothetical protein
LEERRGGSACEGCLGHTYYEVMGNGLSGVYGQVVCCLDSTHQSATGRLSDSQTKLLSGVSKQHAECNHKIISLAK